MPSFKFERQKRLSKRRDFLFIQKKGVRSFGRFLVVVGLRAKNVASGRVGITVPKKVGKAHDRNLIKRRVRHILRLRKDLFLNKDLVIIIKESIRNADFNFLKKDLYESIERINIKPLSRHYSKGESFGQSI